MSEQATLAKLDAEAAKLRAETAVIKAKGEQREAAAIAKIFAEHDHIQAQTRFHGVTVIIAAMLAGATALGAGVALMTLLDRVGS